MTPTQIEQWAALTDETALSYGVSPIGTGPGPIMGPGRRAQGAAAPAPAPRPTLQFRTATFSPVVDVTGRAPLEGIATGPGLKPWTALRDIGTAVGIVVGIGGMWPVVDWNYLLPGLKYLGPFIRSLYTIPAGPGPVFFSPSWSLPLLGPTA